MSNAHGSLRDRVPGGAQLIQSFIDSCYGLNIFFFAFKLAAIEV